MLCTVYINCTAYFSFTKIPYSISQFPEMKMENMSTKYVLLLKLVKLSRLSIGNPLSEDILLFLRTFWNTMLIFQLLQSNERRTLCECVLEYWMLYLLNANKIMYLPNSSLFSEMNMETFYQPRKFILLKLVIL